MAISASSLTRRGLGLALGGLVLAPRAIAAPGLVLPMRVGYARIAPAGFVHIRSAEQDAWAGLQTRLGGLIEIIQPLQPSDMFGPQAPDVDGGASCAMAARQMAAARGLSHVVLYATQDGQTPPRKTSWLANAFASLRSEVFKNDRATGEAHLLDVGGGPAVASASADRPPRNPLNLFDNDRNPERETLVALTESLARQIQSMTRIHYEAQRSIAD